MPTTLQNDIQKIFDILDISIQDLQDACGIAERTAYRWAKGETAPNKRQRMDYIHLLANKVESMANKKLHLPGTYKGNIKLDIDPNSLKICRAEPYIHPLFKKNIENLTIPEVYFRDTKTVAFQQGLKAAQNNKGAFCIEHCYTHAGVIRIAWGWFMSHTGFNNKPMVRYEESWFEQFILPK